MTEFGLRELAHGAEETIVAGADRERSEIVLQRLRIARLDKAHGQRLAVTQAQNICVLAQIIETKRSHGGLPLVSNKTMAGVPKRGGASLAARLCPPKRLFGLVHDVAPRKPDVMQIALGPMGQFATLTLAIPPDVNGIAELRQKPRFMMIYHRFM
jgi:hypothetical protein